MVDGECALTEESRLLNKITMKYRFPLPRMDYLLDSLSGARYFAVIDLKMAIPRIELEEMNGRQHSKQRMDFLHGWSFLLVSLM
jgi:hypothetical protein